MRTDSGYCDVLHGAYNEQEKYKITGKFNNDSQVGEWTEQLPNNILAVATFKKGRLDGPYFEYYYNYKNPRADILWKGQYSVVEYTYAEVAENSMRPAGKQVEMVQSVRIGNWEHYDIIGQLLEIVAYNWKKGMKKPDSKEQEKTENHIESKEESTEIFSR